MNLTDKTIMELSRELRLGKFSVEELLREFYRNIKIYNPKLNAFITIIDEEEAVKYARAKDKNLKNSGSALYGIPFVLKDAYATKGIRTTCASKVLDNYIPQYDATVYRKLIDAGAILIGKMNMDAWGHGGSSENTDYLPVRNPWDIQRSAGGSSGGPAAAIASGMTSFAIGEDTGGSIRNPSAWCGITGLKVTYGRVSRYGTIAYASSFDTVGPMARTSDDCGLILEAIAGQDPYDATSSYEEVQRYSETSKILSKKCTIAIPKELFNAGLDSEIKQSIIKASKIFSEAGVILQEISMPLLEYGLPIYYLIGPSETSSNLARYDGIRYGFGRDNFTKETKRRIMIGTYALSAGYYDAFYKKAQKARTLLIREYNKVFEKCDAILMPVTPTPPKKIGELISNPMENYLSDVYTVTQNPSGLPSLAVPCGFTKGKLPIGMQLVGKMFSESLLLSLGHYFQNVTDWHKRRPVL